MSTVDVKQQDNNNFPFHLNKGNSIDIVVLYYFSCIIYYHYVASLSRRERAEICPYKKATAYAIVLVLNPRIAVELNKNKGENLRHDHLCFKRK